MTPALLLGPIWSHLWQSTVFAILAALLVFAFSANHARSRYWLWFAASIKFLIPFSALVAIGKQFAWRDAHLLSRFAFAMIWDHVNLPLVRRDILAPLASASPAHSPLIPAILAAIWFCGFAGIVLRWLFRWLDLRESVRDAAPITDGREKQALRTLERTARLRRPIDLRISSGRLEPGIFGILQPILLWPAGFSNRLSDAQVEAIIAHEVCHARRHDNLTSAIHMLVEAIFWFHPLVWWIGARLVEERERACDEEVLRLGSEPEVYAESILKTCKFYVESPLACMAGVTGADLKSRIERIMTQRIGRRLDLGKKLVLAASAFCAVGGPIAFGVLGAPSIHAEAKLNSARAHTFDVAFIRRNTSAERQARIMLKPGGSFEGTNVSVWSLIMMAYELIPSQLSGAPDWLRSEKYDIGAKANATDDPEAVRLMVRTLLADRFNLSIHREKRDMPVYVLLAGKDSSKLRPAAQPGREERSLFRIGNGQLMLESSTMAQLADSLSRVLGRKVADLTGMEGRFDINLAWTPDRDGGETAIFSAIRDQLGLKLESQTAPVEIAVIDRVEEPREK